MTYILCDIGHVIVQANGELIHSSLEDIGISPEDARTFFTAPAYRAFSRGQIDEVAFHKDMIVNKLNVPITLDQLRDAHDTHLCGLDHAVVDILDDLRERYPIAIVTDTNPWQSHYINEHIIDMRPKEGGLNPTHLFESHKIRSMKDEDGFFPHVIKTLGIRPEEAHLIDNSPEKLDKAEEIGIHPIPFVGAERLEYDLKQMGLL